jgi:hypothetical protein
MGTRQHCFDNRNHIGVYCVSCPKPLADSLSIHLCPSLSSIDGVWSTVTQLIVFLQLMSCAKHQWQIKLRWRRRRKGEGTLNSWKGVHRVSFSQCKIHYSWKMSRIMFIHHISKQLHYPNSQPHGSQFNFTISLPLTVEKLHSWTWFHAQCVLKPIDFISNNSSVLVVALTSEI